MPVVSIGPNQKQTFPYLYPTTGRIRLTVEASGSVDVFLTRNDYAQFANSFWEAKAKNIWAQQGQKIDAGVLDLPVDWRTGWTLTIANPNFFHVGVHYEVFTA
jgi:hypothetical protein